MTRPKEAIKRLREGNRRFVSGESWQALYDSSHRAELATAQRPFAIVLGCSDSIGFDVRFLCHFGVIWESFLELFRSEGALGAKNAIFTKTYVFLWFLMNSEVRGVQHGIMFGPGGNFFDVQKSTQIFHRFLNPKVTNMAPF